MRILAFDIGEVRTGFAISDLDERIATPVCVLPSKEVQSSAASFLRLLDDWQPAQFLFGLPVTLSGEEGPQAKHIRSIAKRIAQAHQMPYAFCDERLSSAEAKRQLREMGYDERSMKGKVDMIAASIFLQSWLDSNRSQPIA